MVLILPLPQTWKKSTSEKMSGFSSFLDVFVLIFWQLCLIALHKYHGRFNCICFWLSHLFSKEADWHMILSFFPLIWHMFWNNKIHPMVLGNISSFVYFIIIPPWFCNFRASSLKRYFAVFYVLYKVSLKIFKSWSFTWPTWIWRFKISLID